MSWRTVGEGKFNVSLTDKLDESENSLVERLCGIDGFVRRILKEAALCGFEHGQRLDDVALSELFAKSPRLNPEDVELVAQLRHIPTFRKILAEASGCGAEMRRLHSAVAQPAA